MATLLRGGGVSSSSPSGGAAAPLALAFAFVLALAEDLGPGADFAFGKGIALDRDSRVRASCTLGFQTCCSSLN